MNPADDEFVRAMPLFRGLGSNQMDRLLAGASVRRYAKGTLLFEEGQRPEFLHVLMSGSVEAFTAHGGRSRTLLIFSPPNIFLPAAALVGKPYLVSARALKPSRLLLLDSETVRREMAESAPLACRLAMVLAGQFRVAMRHIKDLRTRTGPQRVAAFLLRLIDERGEASGAELPISKGVLASRLGMTAETLSRALQALSEHGIAVRGHRVTLKDRAAVERFCERDPLIDDSDDDLFVRAW